MVVCEVGSRCDNREELSKLVACSEAGAGYTEAGQAIGHCGRARMRRIKCFRTPTAQCHVLPGAPARPGMAASCILHT